MTKLNVQRLPKADHNRLLVRLNIKYREGIDRYGIARITNTENSKSENVLVLGHDDDKAVFMPYDIHTALGLKKGDELDFTLKKVGFWGKLCWYVSSPDPAVQIPAWVAVGGLILAIASLVIGIVSIVF